MKTKFSSYLLLTVFLSCSFLSCSNDDPDPAAAKNKLLTKIDYSSVDDEIYLLEYDTQNRLVKYTEQDKVDGVFVDYRTDQLQYDSNGRIVKIVTKQYGDLTSDHDYVDFTYSSNFIVATRSTYRTYEDGYSWGENRDTLYLNAKGLIEKRVDYSKNSPDGDYMPAYYKTNYTYDANNNLVKEEYVNKENQVMESDVYEYDNQKSIFTNQKTPAWFWVYYGDGQQLWAGKNNCIKRTGDDDSYQISFELDTDGYPIHATSGTTTVKNAFIYKDI